MRQQGQLGRHGSGGQGLRAAQSAVGEHAASSPRPATSRAQKARDPQRAAGTRRQGSRARRPSDGSSAPRREPWRKPERPIAQPSRAVREARGLARGSRDQDRRGVEGAAAGLKARRDLLATHLATMPAPADSGWAAYTKESIRRSTRSSATCAFMIATDDWRSRALGEIYVRERELGPAFARAVANENASRFDSSHARWHVVVAPRRRQPLNTRPTPRLIRPFRRGCPRAASRITGRSFRRSTAGRSSSTSATASRPRSTKRA